jgi:tRNA pseudouridine13 synthase
MDVGYCGLKDRHAITTQWFSVYFGKRSQPDWQRWSLEGTKILQSTTHRSKLRRGDHLGNEFKLIVRNISKGAGVLDDRVKEEIEDRLARLENVGAPNYFGEQRFGHHCNNLRIASEWFSGEKSMKVSAGAMYVSAARAYLFNHLLANRVASCEWDKVIDGDITTENGEVMGSMFGDGVFPESGLALEYVTKVTDAHSLLASGLRNNRIRVQHRPLVLRAKRLKWHWENDNLCVSFCLPVGAFATSFLREVVNYTDLRRDQDNK